MGNSEQRSCVFTHALGYRMLGFSSASWYHLFDYVKKGIGAMVCAIMEANGYEKTGVKKAVPPFPYRVFSRGEVYR
jgi:hypothetical protein